MTIDDKFLSLIADALSACENCRREAVERKELWMLKSCEEAMRQFEKLRSELAGERLLRLPNVGLGITRALSEWAPADLFNAGDAVERYYVDNWSRGR